MPTRQILLDLANDSFEGLIAGNGRLLARPTAARVAGQTVILPVTLSAKIVAGAFVEPVALEITDAVPKWAWTLELKDARDTTLATRTVLVPDGVDPIAVGDLPLVDVCTLQPDAEADAAWWAAVQPFIDAYNAGELQGEDGAPGQSAYELAVANGFVGTEQEWLDSLIGEQGIPGDDGRNPEFNVSGTHIQWRWVGDTTWINLVPLSWITGTSAYLVAVNNGFVGTEAQWLDSLIGAQGIQGEEGPQGIQGIPGVDGEDGESPALRVSGDNIQWQWPSEGAIWHNLVPLADITGPQGPEGSGLKTYANTAALDAETSTVMGTVFPATTWGAYTGMSTLNNYSGEALVQTVASLRSGAPAIAQYMTIGDNQTANAPMRKIMRRKDAGGTWEAWHYATLVPTPTQPFEAANKLYADTVGLTLVSSWAGLDSLTQGQYHATTGRVQNPGFDLGAATGIAKYNGWGMGEVWFENAGGYSTGDVTAQVQRAWIPNLDGTVDEIRRSRAGGGAWSAWEIYTPSGGGSGTIESIVAGTNVTVDDTDPANPIISATGDPGPEGPSAYDVAVTNGFVGTEAEWLLSLEGEPGADSTVPGPPGVPGVGEGGYGLPAGGTIGQVPVKASLTDGDVAWEDPSGGSGGGGPYQYVPPIGGVFSSSFWRGTTTSGLRDRNTTPMPILLAETITIDQVIFELTTVAAAAGQTIRIRLRELSGSAWINPQTLASGIPVDATTGARIIDITPVVLNAGTVYGIDLYEEQAYDTTLKVRTGSLSGPGINVAAPTGWGSHLGLPVGANSAIVPENGVPVIKLRRSA